jgi:hypothetical protein
VEKGRELKNNGEQRGYGKGRKGKGTSSQYVDNSFY